MSEIPYTAKDNGETELSDSHSNENTSHDNVFSRLTQLRDIHKYNEVGLWSDERLHTAIEGAQVYVNIYDKASENLKEYMKNEDVIQCFIGIKPVVRLANQNLNTENITPHVWDKEKLFAQIKDEFDQLLQESGSESIKIAKVDRRKVKYGKGIHFELMNIPAVDCIAADNADLFTNNNANNYQWLIDHPEMWTMTPQGTGEDEIAQEIRSGVLSGFPRSACNKFAEVSTSGIDWKTSIINLLKHPSKDPFVNKIIHEPLRTSEVYNTRQESGLHFEYYTREDVDYANSATRLSETLAKEFSFPPVKK